MGQALDPRPARLGAAFELDPLYPVPWELAVPRPLRVSKSGFTSPIASAPPIRVVGRWRADRVRLACGHVVPRGARHSALLVGRQNAGR
jgi:hypothetical protein